MNGKLEDLLHDFDRKTWLNFAFLSPSPFHHSPVTLPAHPIHSPYHLSSPLTAPRAQPPPSQIPTERLTTTAERWANGTLQASPTPPPSLNPLNHQQQNHYTPSPMGQYQNNQGAPYGGGGGAAYLNPQGGGGHLSRPQSYSVGTVGGGNGQGYPSGSATMHARPASYAAPPLPPNSYGQFPPPAIPQQQQAQQPPPPPPNFSHPTNPYFPATAPPPQQQLPPMQQGYLAATPAPMTGGGGPPPNGNFVGRPPRVASMQANDFQALQNGMGGLSLSGSNQSIASSTGGRPNYYANPEDGPPHKLSVTHPDVSFTSSPSFMTKRWACFGKSRRIEFD